MRILYISGNELEGSRFNGYETFSQLCACGHDPNFLVWDKLSQDKDVYCLRQGYFCKIANALGNRFDRLMSLRAFAVMGSHFIPAHPAFQGASVVHLQLLHSTPFFSLFSLPRLARLKPVVWTLHDPWAITGHCVHPAECDRWQHGCGKCPDKKRLFPIYADTTAAMYRYKQKTYCKAAMDIVVASRWMRSLLERSPMFANHRVHVIPFGLDLTTFRPVERDGVRRLLGIAADAFVVFFRNSSWDLKGAGSVVEALKHLQPSRPLHIVTVQRQGGLEALANFPVTELGWIGNAQLMAGVFSAADVFVMPSHESFGMMALESLACGTPVICLEGSAVAELCRPPQAGLVVPEGDMFSLAAAMQQMMDDRIMHARQCDNAVRIAQEYSLTRHVQALLDVYASAMERYDRASSRNRRTC